MEDKDKLRMAKIAADIERAKQDKVNEANNRLAAAQSFTDAWSKLREDVVLPAFTDYAVELAALNIEHQVADIDSPSKTVRGVTFCIGAPSVTSHPRPVMFKMIPDLAGARITVSYDPVTKPTVVIGSWAPNQITSKNVHAWLNDAFEHGGYGR